MKTLNKSKTPVLLMCLLVLIFFSTTGCKKKSEPAAPVEAKEPAKLVVEQTTCPVMDGPINKDLYVEYQGKKVYFCCLGCQEKFKAEPEKYLSKLPQFNN
jgi:YHS domain-containing protein